MTPFALADRIAIRVPDGLAEAAWLWFVLRLGLGILALLVVISGTAGAPCPSDAELQAFLPVGGVAFPLVGVWQHWDACWYTTIAAYGYRAGTGSTNMFPLLPFLMAGVAGTKGSIVVAALAVNAVAFIVGLTGLHQLVERDFDRPVAQRAVTYLAIFPAAFFFIAPFTESLFLAASVWAILGARSGRWRVALVAGAAATLARPTGVLLVLPLAWEALWSWHDRWRAGRFRLSWPDVAMALAVAAPLIAYGGFILFTVWVGEPYFGANARWGSQHLELPWNRFADAIAFALDRHRPIQAINVVAWTLFAGLTVAAVRLLPVSYWIFVVPQLVLMLTQDNAWPLMSTIRYLAVLFPCFVVLALAARRFPRLGAAWAALSLLLLGYLTTQFVQGAMVG